MNDEWDEWEVIIKARIGIDARMRRSTLSDNRVRVLLLETIQGDSRRRRIRLDYQLQKIESAIIDRTIGAA